MPRAPNSAATSGLRADRRIRFGMLCRICAPKCTSVSVSCCATVPVSRQTARSVLPFLRASDRHRARKSACPHVGPLFRTQTRYSKRGQHRPRAEQEAHVRNRRPTCGTGGPRAEQEDPAHRVRAGTAARHRPSPCHPLSHERVAHDGRLATRAHADGLDAAARQLFQALDVVLGGLRQLIEGTAL